MEKILGKVVIIICLAFNVFLQAYVNLEVNSFDGRSITEVSAGEAFILKISTDEVDQVNDFQIQGLQGFPVRKTGLSLITINGKKTAQISYQVEIDKPGAYTFGPASVPNGQSKSNVVPVKVNAERLTHHLSAKKEKDAAHNAVILQLIVDRDMVFVGQKIKTLLRAYFPEGEDISIDQVISNDPATIEVTDKVGPKKGTETIAGKNYIVLEWQWEMYPKEAGSLVIPAYFLDYAKALPVQQGFGGLAMFFGPRYERKRAYSNALSIQVRPLPEPQQFVNGIGTFVSYRAQIKPSIAKKYEGAVLSLTIEGEGNTERIKDPELKGLPDELKYYFSKSYVTPNNVGGEKTFEYIVQGMQEGEWEIPSQQFTFFDVESRTYKMLESGPLLITIIPGQAVAKPQEDNRKTALAQQEPPVQELLQNMMSNASNSGKPIPMSWFAFLFCLPLGIFAGRKILSSSSLVQKISQYYISRRAFALAQKELAKAYRKHDITAIHGLFVQLISRRTGRDDGEFFDKVIQESQWSDMQKKSWQEFYEKIAQAAYADNYRSQDIVRLFHESAQRLTDLKGII